MANNFSGDTNCVACWRLESDALTTDALGKQSALTDNGTVQSDTTNYKEGSGSAYFADANNEYFSITDANLDTDFPLQSSGGTTLSVCFWIRPTAASKGVWAKAEGGDGGISCVLTSLSKINFRCYDSGGLSADVAFGTGFTLNQWYHVTFTHNSADATYRLRIWDDTASAQLGADVTGTLSKTLDVCNDSLRIGGNGIAATELDGNLDEFVVFKDVLSAAEIDAIRAGTYGASGATTPFDDRGVMRGMGRGTGRGTQRMVA